MRKTLRSLVPAVLAFLLLGGSALSRHSIALAQSDDNSARAQITNKILNKSQYKNVQVTVTNGIAKLTGTVDLFSQKEDLDKRVHKVKGVTAVDNEVEIAGPEISDAQLQEKLVRAIAYDRVGYGTTPFNAISVNVNNGVVTLGGTAYGPVDADSAVAVASNTKGVKDVINDISVDPVSPMDDQIRRAVYRAVYGFPSLNRYAIDPAQPIRISVQNGNVTLYGVVDRQADKDAAGIRANTVPGVFKVTNDLVVAGQPQKK